ncbi:histidine kinase [Actinoplanes sp. NPDC051861]|uniref:sensor histidine kinase n=1 Tax=Actinoplanes sp. NPDC051861 TaxID=3155170 RepID=UPI00341532C5
MIPRRALIAAVLLGTAGAVEAVWRSGPEPVTLVLTLCATVPVVVLPARLTAVAAALTGSVLLTLVLGVPPTAAGLVALLGTLSLVGVLCPYPMALLFGLPFVVYAVGPISSRPGGEVFGALLLVAAAGVLTLGAARQSRVRAVARREVIDARNSMAYASASRTERTRIARELHDVVAHHISLISVRAETARFTVRDLPADGAARFLEIGETARQALAEMRLVLGVLRDGAEPVAAEHPQPGLDQLLTLVDQARAAGGPRIRLIVSGPARRLDPGLELTAYRIAQEALTNVRRHAPGAAVDIEVGYHPDRLRLHVWNTWGGRGEPRGEGFGLIGMRERVALAGGTLRTGNSSTGGFVVEAVLPLPGAAR